MEKRKFLFLYHKKEREYTICRIIKDAICRQNSENEVLIANFDEEYRIAYTFKPNILITIPPRAEWAASILTIIKEAVNPIIISMVTEGLHDLDLSAIKLMIGYNEYSSRLVDYYMYWGPKPAQIFGQELLAEKKITTLDRIKVFGYVMYEKNIIRDKFEAHPLNLQLKEKKNKYDRIITWVTGFHGADETIEQKEEMGCFRHEDESSYAKELAEAKKKIKASQTYRTTYVSNIITIAKKYPKVCFVVKLHPIEVNIRKENGEDSYNELRNIENILLVEENVPLGVILPYTDIFIHYGSTTGLEAYIYKVPTVQLTAEEDRYPYTNYGKVFFPSTCTVDIDSKEIEKSVIDKIISFEIIDELEKFLWDRFNYRSGETYAPSEIVADFLNKELSQQSIAEEPMLKSVLESQVAFWERESLYKRIITDVFKLKLGAAYASFQIVNQIKPHFGIFLNDIWTKIIKK